jgi:hypothetical protein
MIPRNINEGHIKDALRQIDAEGVPPRRKSRGYDLIYFVPDPGLIVEPTWWFILTLADGRTPGMESWPTAYTVRERM